MKIWNQAGTRLTLWAAQTQFTEVCVLILERGIVTPYTCTRTGGACDIVWARLQQ